MSKQPDNQQPSLEVSRKCKVCAEIKPLDLFAPTYSMKSRGKNYRQHTCMDCHRIRCADKERKLRRKNPEVYRDACRAHYHRNKKTIAQNRRKIYLNLCDEVFQAYGGYKCVCCGETEKSMLTMDHVNNDGSKHRRELKLRWSKTMYHWIKTHGFPSTFQVLCYNCNLSKFRNNGICAHLLKGSTTRT